MTTEMEHDQLCMAITRRRGWWVPCGRKATRSFLMQEATGQYVLYYCGRHAHRVSNPRWFGRQLVKEIEMKSVEGEGQSS